MMISTKGRYALGIMLDLTLNGKDGYVSLTDIAARQDVSLKYLEAIVSTLYKAGLVESLRGKNGGYKLARAPEKYTVGEILKTTEGSLAPVSCLENCSSGGCERIESCLSAHLWRALDAVIDGYLEGVTLEDVAKGRVPMPYSEKKTEKK